MKLTFAQSTLLRLIAQGCARIEDGDGTWLPPRGGQEALEAPWAPDGTPFVHVAVGGSGTAAAYRALVQKGLIVESRLAGYAAKITPAGREQAEKERGKPVAWAVRVRGEW